MPEEVTPEEIEEAKPEEIEETKPNNRNRPELKEKANCPDCGKELTVHGLKYTHARYCKAKQPARVEPPGLDKPISELHQTPTQKRAEPMNVTPTILATIISIEHNQHNPTYDQISAYLLNQKKMRVNNKR